METIHLVLLLVFLLTVSFLPGRVILEFFPLTKYEKFSLSFGVSYLLYYCIGFLGYILNINAVQFHSTALVALIILPLFANYRKRFITGQDVYCLVILFAVFILAVSIQGLLPVYAGGQWYFDWYEHYVRMLFFLERLPLFTQIGSYILPSRPPFFNVVAYFYQSMVGKDFWIFQIVSVFLNLTVLLACFTFVTHILKKFSLSIFVLVFAFFLLNPSFIIQTTFTWSKGLAAYFVLSGFYLYLQFKTGKAQGYLSLASIFFASGVLTHYSSLPFVSGFFTDLLIQTFGAPKIYFRLFVYAGSIFMVVTSSWFIWSIVHYGARETFLSNTSYEWQKNLSPKERIIKDLTNFRNTFLPILPREYRETVAQQKNPLVILYDNSFGFYATTIPGQVTLTLFLLLVYYTFTKYKNIFQVVLLKKSTLFSFREITRHPLLPWAVFILVSIVLGIISLPTKHQLGSAHVVFLPLGMLISCLAITAFIKLPKFTMKIITLLIFLGIGFEALVGIGLRIYVLRYDMNPTYLHKTGRSEELELLLPIHTDNYLLKTKYGLVFLADKYKNLDYIFLSIVSAGEILCIFYIAFYYTRRRDFLNK